MRTFQWTAASVRRHMAGVLLSLFLSGAVLAQDAAGSRAPEMPVDPSILFRGLITEHDIALVFRHLRENLLGAADGDGTVAADELAQRSDEIRREIQLRGTQLGVAILDVLERGARDALRGSPLTAPKQTPSTARPFD